ncbi:MAG: hypothetical protein M3Z31_04595 [Pseudomonadota bacterium]|nr:hypothetical protein [Pseudomonadota bacterium]
MITILASPFSRVFMNTCRELLACACIVLPLSVAAGPADYVYTPNVEYGEREIDFKIGSARSSGQDRFSAGSVGFGYGVTERWFTEIYAKYEKGGGDSTRFDAFEWENRFALTEQGRYPFDMGFVIELERPRDRAEGYEVRLGPLFQTDWDRWQLNLNLLLERHFRTEEESHTELGYQWQARYLSSGKVDIGLQGFGELGRWRHWARSSEQNHRAGPAVFGKANLGGRHVIKYNAAVLFGLTGASPDHTVRAQVEYEF